MNGNLTPDVQAQLDLLRDISLPQAVSWWPLAPGWWLVAGITLALFAAGLVYYVLRRRSLRYIALQELAVLRREAADIHHTELATRLSVLLHRVSMAVDGRQTGMLSDVSWSGYLSKGEQGMARDVAECIASAPYRQTDSLQTKHTVPDRDSLLDSSEIWIRRHT